MPDMWLPAERREGASRRGKAARWLKTTVSRLGVAALVVLGLGAAWTGCAKEEKPAEPAAAASPAPHAEAPPQSTGDTAKPARDRETAEAPQPPGVATAGEETTFSYDKQKVAALCESAKLPAPPDLSALPPDLARSTYGAIQAAAGQQSADAIGRLGMIYIVTAQSRDDLSRAIDCLDRAHTLAPDSFKWPYYLGRVFLARKSFERARLEFEEAIKLNPDYAMSHAWIGEIELLRDAPAEAKAAFQQYLGMCPRDAYGHVGIAEAEIMAGNVDAAQSEAEVALAIDSNIGRPHVVLAKCHKQKEEHAPAAQEFAIAERLPPITGSFARDPLELELWASPGPTNMVFQKIVGQASAGDAADADALAEKMASAYPKDADLLASLAEIYLTWPDYEKAASYAEKALAINANQAAAHLVLAQYRFVHGDFEKAIAHADQSIASSPKSAPPYVFKARAMAGVGRLTDAEQTLRSAVEIDPASPLAHKTLADLLASQERLEEAKEHYHKAVDLAETAGTMNPEIAGAYQSLANIAKAEGDDAEAIRVLKHAVEKNPGFEAPLSPLFQLMLAANRGDEALAFCDHLMTTWPEQQRRMLRYIYGDLLLKMDRVEEAGKYAVKWIDDSPASASAFVLLAAVHQRLGDMTKAKQSLHRAITMRPTYTPAYEALVPILIQEKNYKALINILRTGVGSLPDNAGMTNTLAWYLATCPDETLRDPKQAVPLAEKAVELSGRQRSSMLDTLGCAYAAAGRFDDAVEAERLAIERASAEPEASSAEFAKRLEMFQNKQAYVEPQ